MAVSGVVGFIVASFLSGPPGMESWLKFVGTIAAIGGGALGILVHKASGGQKALFVVAAVAVFVGAVIGFRTVLAGEPGGPAADILLVCTAAMFMPIGFLIELVGLKLTADGKGDGE